MRQFFTTTLGHILIIISGSTIVTFMVLCTLLFIPKGPPGPPWPWQTTYRIGSLVHILRATPPEHQAAIIAAAQEPGMQFSWQVHPGRCSVQTFNTWDLRKTLSYELGGQSDIEVNACNPQEPRKHIQVIVPMGKQFLVAKVDSIGREPTRFTFPTLCAALFLLIGIAVMSVWAIARIISPLRALSETADAFSRDITVVPVKEEGPHEIRRVAQTFNLMQQRIAQYMQSRNKMLAAISHDLRTPLTRMRLCLDTYPTDIARIKIIRDIELMNKLIGSALMFIRTGSDGEQPDWIDLNALMSTLCDEYEDGGLNIDYDSPPGLNLYCKPDAIQRVLTNLIDNAAAYSQHISIVASQTEKLVTLAIIDDGPGINPEMLERVKEPFFRLDNGRHSRPGSNGLGLSIVNEIVLLHGGTFHLTNASPTGLIATVTLPKMA